MPVLKRIYPIDYGVMKWKKESFGLMVSEMNWSNFTNLNLYTGIF